MSISEILLVIVVALLVVKPEDLPEIIKFCKKISAYFYKVKKDILSLMEDEEDDLAEINKYLLKISALDAKYNGEYRLHEIRSFYHQLLKKSSDTK